MEKNENKTQSVAPCWSGRQVDSTAEGLVVTVLVDSWEVHHRRYGTACHERNGENRMTEQEIWTKALAGAADILRREAQRVDAIFPDTIRSKRRVGLHHVSAEYRLIADEILALKMDGTE